MSFSRRHRPWQHSSAGNLHYGSGSNHVADVVGRRRWTSSNNYYGDGVMEVGVTMPSLKRRRLSSSSTSNWQQGASGIQHWHQNAVLRSGVDDDPSVSNHLLSYPQMMLPRVDPFPVGKKSENVELAVDEDPIFMSRDEIESCSPSRKDGIDAHCETRLRYSYCAFLQKLGMRLKLPQTTIATAMVFCHRFFVRRSHAFHDRFMIATAALFLAAKSEETPCPLNNVVRACNEICQKQNQRSFSFMLPVDWHERYRESIIESEHLILTTLDFELNVQHPYSHLTSILNKLGLTQSVLVNMAWNLINEGDFMHYSPTHFSAVVLAQCQHSCRRFLDYFHLMAAFIWLRSSLWLQFKPHHIAAGAAYLAAQFLKSDLGSCQDIWQEFQTGPSILQDVAQQLLELL